MIFYRQIMKIAHRFNWHYAPPIYPENDTQLWCQWCGFRETIKGIKYNPAKTDHKGKNHLCTVGCPLYSSGHSISADGYCNMGCC